MLDDPDARLEAAEPASEPVIEAPAVPRPSGKAPYHQPIADELLDDLALAIGKGLALVELDERSSPSERVEAIAGYLDGVASGARRLPGDRADAELSLACLLGQSLCRLLGWGFAHVRRTRSPGIMVVSPDRRHAAAPRAVITRALSGEAGSAVRAWVARLASGALPAAEPGRYLRLE